MQRRSLALLLGLMACDAAPAEREEQRTMAASAADMAASAADAAASSESEARADEGALTEDASAGSNAASLDGGTPTASPDASGDAAAGSDAQAPALGDAQAPALGDAGPGPLDAGPPPCDPAPVASECAPGELRFGFDESGVCAALDARSCAAKKPAYATLAQCESACRVQPAPQPCAIDVDDAGLPGVRIHVEGARCNLRRGQPAVFRYRVELTRPIAYRVAAGTSCGYCGRYGSDASELLHAGVGEGPNVYCPDCDVGCCPPNRDGRYELAPSSHEGELYWPGVTWNGPSDTSQPYGPPFPPGEHAVTVKLAVPGVGVATAKLPITVTD